MHMPVVPTRHERALHRLPLDAEHPASMPRENVRQRLGGEVPEAGMCFARSRDQDIARWGEGGAEDRGGVA